MSGRKSKRVRLKDIAEKAGVSVNTVSKVLRGEGAIARISEITGKRVRRIAKELDYIPDQTARSLRGGRSGLIGVFVAEMTDPIYAGITAR